MPRRRFDKRTRNLGEYAVKKEKRAKLRDDTLRNSRSANNSGGSSSPEEWNEGEEGVKIEDPTGTNTSQPYSMVEEGPDGAWRVTGVRFLTVPTRKVEICIPRRPKVAERASRRLTSSTGSGEALSQAPHFDLDGPPIQINSSIGVYTSGAFGDVHLGWHVVEGKVALKRPRLRGRHDVNICLKNMRAEAAVWEKLDHPNVLKFIGIFEVDRMKYLVSPFAENGSLLDYLQRHSRNVDRRRTVAQIADGLNYLHSFEPGIIHGDVKADNVVVASDHRVQLCDFGLSRHIDEKTNSNLRGAGSDRWLCPEFLKGVAPRKTFKSDVYAFGITISEVLKGEPPFARESVYYVIHEVPNGLRPPMEPSVGPDGMPYDEVWREAERCWAGHPTMRPSMDEVARRLWSAAGRLAS